MELRLNRNVVGMSACDVILLNSWKTSCMRISMCSLEHVWIRRISASYGTTAPRAASRWVM